MKKHLAIIIALLLVCSVTLLSVQASLNTYNKDVSLSISLNKKAYPVSTSEQQAVMTVSTSKAVDLFSIGYTVVIPNGWKITAIESGSDDILFKESAGHFSLKTGIVSWFSASNVNTDVIAKITFSIPGNTQAGSYSVGLQNVELATSDQNRDEPWMSKEAVTASVTIGDIIPVTGITLNTETASLNIGETLTLIPTVLPANASDNTVIWSSDNPAVAAVKNGVITAVSSGTAVITATAEEKSAACTVTVKEAEPVKDPVIDCSKDSACPISDFSDTLVDFWWHDGIHYCLENGLMNGVGKNASGQNCFDPNGITSRAMIVTILWRLEGKPSVNYDMTFKDIPAGMWYTEAIRWASSVGVVNGYDANKFGPDDNITREQLVTILYRYATNIKNKDKTLSLNKSLSFADTNLISKYAVDAVRWCYEAGIVQGKNNNLFDPLGDATRAEAATMIYRFCKLMND